MNYYGNLDEKVVRDNRKFGKTVKPFLSDKLTNSDKLHLNENGELIKVLIEFFLRYSEKLTNSGIIAIFKRLKIQCWRQFWNKKPFQYHCNKRKIWKLKIYFSWSYNEKIIRGIKRLNKNKAFQKSDILITIIHENNDILADFLAESLKGTIKTDNFPNCLKLADITPLYKKGKKDNKEDHRPVSILPTLFKILERILFEQISVCFDKFLSD